MYSSLLPHMFGIRASFAETIELAARYNFAGVDVEGLELFALTTNDIKHLRERLEQTSIRPGYVAMPPSRTPVNETQWNEAIDKWPQIARVARQLGYTRAALVFLPFHETLNREDALEEHVHRLSQAAAILNDYGIRLGLEYIAAPSRRAPYETHTIYNLAGMLELIERVGASNLGLMLDTFHWHGAGETTDDLKKLRAEQIVVVHVNDAPDLPLDQHVVTQRALPAATGVIDVEAFIRTLKDLGYDGPITCEPMQPAIDALGLSSGEMICATVKQSLDNILRF